MTRTAVLPCGLAANPQECAAVEKGVNGALRDKRGESIRAFVAVNKPAIGRLLHGVFEIQTFEEAEKLSSMLASHCPDPALASVGIWELVSNAIEHGNLEIDRALKTDLLLTGVYWDELARRLASDEFSARVVIVDFRRTKTSIRIRVVDQGKGFDFARVLSEEPAQNAPNGRGLLMARTMSFHRLKFKGTGNIVDAAIRCS